MTCWKLVRSERRILADVAYDPLSLGARGRFRTVGGTHERDGPPRARIPECAARRYSNKHGWSLRPKMNVKRMPGPARALRIVAAPCGGAALRLLQCALRR